MRLYAIRSGLCGRAPSWKSISTGFHSDASGAQVARRCNADRRYDQQGFLRNCKLQRGHREIAGHRTASHDRRAAHRAGGLRKHEVATTLGALIRRWLNEPRAMSAHLNSRSLLGCIPTFQSSRSGRLPRDRARRHNVDNAWQPRGSHRIAPRFCPNSQWQSGRCACSHDVRRRDRNEYPQSLLRASFAASTCGARRRAARTAGAMSWTRTTPMVRRAVDARRRDA